MVHRVQTQGNGVVRMERCLTKLPTNVSAIGANLLEPAATRARL